MPGEYESFISLDIWTMIFQWCNLLILFYFMKKLLFKPVMNIIEKRQQEIDKLYSDGDAALGEANRLRQEYEEKLSGTKEEAAQLLAQAQNTAQKRSDDMIAAARRESEAIKDKAFSDIELEKKKARDDLKAELSVIAVDIASKVVEREISADDHAAFIDGFISDMGDGQ